MFSVQYFFYFIFIPSIVGTPQINLYYTDWIDESDNVTTQHHCLRVLANMEQADKNRHIMSYCMNELSSKFEIENEDLFPNFTFAELSKLNISSYQLYLWSTPIDLIEHYQFYLNQLSISNDSSLTEEVFYNCTLPRFGPMCQYQFYYNYPHQSSLYEIIYNFYRTSVYMPTTLTCFTHLKCNRGPYPACLDWGEICNGIVDCLDGEFDEEHCEQLYINTCKNNEYQCDNGQCIPQLFHGDDINVADCLDLSDEPLPQVWKTSMCITIEPSFTCEDSICENTYSCGMKRDDLLIKAMFSVKDHSISDNCWSAFKCLIGMGESRIIFDELCPDQYKCVEIIEDSCPDMLYIPAIPILFGDIYFAYQKTDAKFLINRGFQYPYVCYNNSRYDHYFVNASKRLLFNKTMCYYRNDIPHTYDSQNRWLSGYVKPLKRDLWDYTQISHNFYGMCNRSNKYQCANSLTCVPLRSLMNKKLDCPYGDDENFTEPYSIMKAEELVGIYWSYTDEVKTKLRDARKNILFQTICDGFTELLPQLINGRNETDETECEQWQCNNIYTRCDNVWNCLNGADELDCNLSLPFNCSSKHHLCISPDINEFMCLPIKQANDGKIDCLGATDEPILCRPTYPLELESSFYCINHTFPSCHHYNKLCNNHKDCFPQGDDEQFCRTKQIGIQHVTLCGSRQLPSTTDVEKFLCQSMKPKKKQPIKYLSLDGKNNSTQDPVTDEEVTTSPKSFTNLEDDRHQSRCHRGLDLRVWLDNRNNLTNETCLCPPSYYGDKCQYQNQRISLSLKFRSLSDSLQTLFAIVVLLIDSSDERIIHSYEQFSYLSTRDCKIKFHIYLLYSTRPKNSTKQYSIHIDFYEKMSLAYRGSILLPVDFLFLPIQRLAFLVDIPQSDDKRTQICQNDRCINGKCIKYTNNGDNQTFCQCNNGWSGQYCTIQHTCLCSHDSLCLGISANNRSICVCPMNKFGPRCLLTETICQTNTNLTCQNDGQCIPNDDFMMLNQKFVCICRKGFFGNRCQFIDNRLILSFDKDIILSQSIFIHFIEVINMQNKPVRVTIFQTIPFQQHSLTIHWSRPFHLVFIELFNKQYYLIIFQKIYNRSTVINKTIHSSDRCPHISEVLNETIVQLDLLRRIKYYHLPCQTYSPNLQCFYDDVHLCLCYDFDEKRLTNCFEFKHNMTFNCNGQSICENDARCLQDAPDCPSKSICMCPPCFYGRKCQFSTNGFGLSLDAILGYHIHPHLSITDQPLITKMSLVLAIIYIVAGLINGVLSLITFKNKIICEVGCGLYLLGTSITTLLTIIMFSLKFSFLLLAQMTIISNRSFLLFQCHSMDFIVRVCLQMDQWLNACVAFERAMTAIKGANFVKNKSKQAAKYVIIILLIVIIGTCVHDPIYRRLIDEENDEDNSQKRTWCIITYPSSLQIYIYMTHIFHFCGPFIINLISVIILIKKQSLQQYNVHKQQRPYKEYLRKQLRQHKNLLIAPVILVVLAVPRLIIIFISKCMESGDDAWLFLVGYFISFIPSMLTFLIFILPSKFYRKEFRRTLVSYQTQIRRRLYRTS